MQYFKKPQLELVVTDDRQYLIKSSTEPFVFTNEREGAEIILELLLKIDWKVYKNLQNYRDLEPEKYEKVAKEIRKYAVPKKLNGNYLNSLKNGIVEYKLDKTIVKGYHLENGVAYRPLSDGKVCLDIVYSALPYMAFENEEHIKAFLNLTKDALNFNKEALGQKILNNYHYNEFIKSAYIKAVNPNHPISSIPVEEKAAFEYDLYINDASNGKKEAYIEAMTEVNKMCGMELIKAKLNQALINREADQALNRVKVKPNTGLHSLFVGPPGTGKTQLARLMAKLYWSMGYIKENKCVEVSKEDLVTQYIGGTEIKTQEKIEEALGGFLFVDEAYTLVEDKSDSGSKYGKIALEIIMRKMENHSDNLAVIFAGYENEIEDLLNVNPGLPSRFNDRFEFENYTVNELVEISKIMLMNKGFNVAEIDEELKNLMKNKSLNGILSGNARTVRVLTEKIIKNHKEEIVKNNGSLLKISPNSVKKLYFSPSTADTNKLKEFKEAGLKELNSMVGLKTLKQKITSWANYLTIEMKRSQLVGETKKIRLHMSFEGSPGTGKTTVARLMGAILKGVGAVENGKVIEVIGKDLVAGYQGQTTPKVQELFKKAKGGLLFIDEVYQMVKSEDDIFGLEAVDALVAEMENNSDVVVIIAGYTKDVEKFLSWNAGLPSRIAERFLFEDYTQEELVEIFSETLERNGFNIDEDGIEYVKQVIREEFVKKGVIDGNGRWIRNLFEKMKVNQADRLIPLANIPESALFILTKEDVPKLN